MSPFSPKMYVQLIEKKELKYILKVSKAIKMSPGDI